MMPSGCHHGWLKLFLGGCLGPGTWNESLRPFSVSQFFGIGPVVAFLSLLRRLFSNLLQKVLAALPGLRPGYLPALLIPVEWVLPPVLIFLGVGELEATWMPLRIVGLVVCLSSPYGSAVCSSNARDGHARTAVRS